MSPFSSPWQSSVFVGWVGAVRRVLRPFGDLESRFIAAVVRRQNRRVRAHFRGRPVSSVLLIMPRCVKPTNCRADVQASLRHCTDCTRCDLGEVARLCEAFDLEAAVAFRSHIAFDIARRRAPDLIVASACHDRLIKALRSVPEIPALLTPLAGMEKMCVNATVDTVWLRDQLSAVTGKSPSAVLRPTGQDGCPVRGRA